MRTIWEFSRKQRQEVTITGHERKKNLQSKSESNQNTNGKETRKHSKKGTRKGKDTKAKTRQRGGVRR